jgi:hypothetical protein
MKSGEKMKILIIGGYGTIGKKVSAHLSKKHEIVIAGRTSGDVTVNIADCRSIEAMFETIGKIDAVLCIAGEAKWAAFDSLTEEDFYIGLKSKLMGQVNLAGKSCKNWAGLFEDRRVFYAYYRDIGRLSCCNDYKCCHGKWRHSQLCQSSIFRIKK